MTAATSEAQGTTGLAGVRSSQVDVVARQVRAISAFHDVRRAAEAAARSASRSRESRMDAERRLAVLRREHDALIARSHEQLVTSARLLPCPAERRAVLAHRNEWFTSKVTRVLQDTGISVVACVDNGADAVGLAVAEQPDLVLVEDCLVMLSGTEVVRSVRRFCPETLVAAQVAHGDRVDALQDAGAAAVFTRRVPPADVGARLGELACALS